MYPSTSRGPMMNALSLFIFAGQSFGGALFGWIGMRAGYQWCYGVQAIAGGVSVIINLCLLRETRADVLLKWKAARLTKSTGIPHLTGDESLPLRDKLKASAIRPLREYPTIPNPRIPVHRAHRLGHMSVDRLRVGLHLPLGEFHPPRVRAVRLGRRRNRCIRVHCLDRWYYRFPVKLPSGVPLCAGRTAGERTRRARSEVILGCDGWVPLPAVSLWIRLDREERVPLGHPSDIPQSEHGRSVHHVPWGFVRLVLLQLTTATISQTRMRHTAPVRRPHRAL